ncbi:hypothetical protein HDU84_000692 [Entophlyctis sp. JEL0112]|nr:hypothetical protein HDU84_000692 [Entophlyctis sp. JEL0112]
MHSCDDFLQALKTVDRYYLAPVVRAIAQSIFFQRSFILTTPAEVYLDQIDVSYVRVDDPEARLYSTIDQLIDDKIASLQRSLDPPSAVGPTSTASSVASSFKSATSAMAMIAARQTGATASTAGGQHSFVISFIERKAKRNSSAWFPAAESSGVPWEQWNIKLNLTQSTTERDQINARASISRELRAVLVKIVQIANENKDHIPTITSQDGYPFPMVLSFSSEAQSWGGLIKNFIGTGNQSILGI